MASFEISIWLESVIIRIIVVVTNKYGDVCRRILASKYIFSVLLPRLVSKFLYYIL